jgi:hypothetical protein
MAFAMARECLPDTHRQAQAYCPTVPSARKLAGYRQLMALVEIEISRVVSKNYIGRLRHIRSRLRTGEQIENDKRILAGIIEVEFACGRGNASWQRIEQELGVTKLRKRFTIKEIRKAIDDGTHYLCEFCIKRFSCPEVKNKIRCKEFDADYKD